MSHSLRHALYICTSVSYTHPSGRTQLAAAICLFLCFVRGFEEEGPLDNLHSVVFLSDSKAFCFTFCLFLIWKTKSYSLSSESCTEFHWAVCALCHFFPSQFFFLWAQQRNLVTISGLWNKRFVLRFCVQQDLKGSAETSCHYFLCKWNFFVCSTDFDRAINFVFLIVRLGCLIFYFFIFFLEHIILPRRPVRPTLRHRCMRAHTL